MNGIQWNRWRYTLYTPFYDGATKILERGRRESLAQLGLRHGERVLIVGVGTGLDLPYLPLGIDLTVADLTPAMVARTSQRAMLEDRRLSAAIMNAHTLALPDDTFDAVILHLILSVVPDPVACIQEAGRVLAPHGRVAIFDKFLPDGAAASRLRNALNLVTTSLFFDMNRQLGPLLAAAGLRATVDRPVLLGGAYRAVVARHHD